LWKNTVSVSTINASFPNELLPLFLIIGQEDRYAGANAQIDG
jgi:hypothetical protein